MRRIAAVLASLCVLIALPLGAQDDVPKRTKLAELADTNDPQAYFDRGIELLEREPQQAAVAFYWASRLNPAWPEALYARRLAGFMSDEGMMLRYESGESSTIASKKAQRLDTLEFRAQMMNPFFLRDLDRPYFVQWVISAVNDGRRRGGAPPLTAADQVELDYAIEGLIRTGLSFRGRANLAASQRQFDEALGLYNRALSGSRDKPGIRWNRARIFYLMGAADSALNELQLAVNELREKDAAKLSLWYRSKEFYEHAMGMIHERRGDLAGAKEAYGRALQEHLSYYPAHVRLAALALRAGDTIQALSEFELAAQVAPNEPLVRLTYGALLAQTGKADDAEPHLRRVVELEPFFATPHYLLGRVAEQKGNTDGATQEYQAFLRLASKKDVRRGDVTQRLADIRE